MNIRSVATRRMSPRRGWAPIVVLPAGVLLLTPAEWPRWLFMWLLASVVFAGCKWLTWRRTTAAGRPWWLHTGYLLAWPSSPQDKKAFSQSEIKQSISNTTRAGRWERRRPACISRSTTARAPWSTQPWLGGAPLTGLLWSEQDQRRVERDGSPSRLIIADPERAPRGTILQWVNAGEKEGLAKRFYCRRRRVWYALRDDAVPDAFLHYMGEEAPRIVLNLAGALTTNAIHRLWWRDEIISPESVTIGTCTSLFVLACELRGRKYGGGVLKVEPGAATRLPVPVVPAVQEKRVEIDALLRNRKLRSARELADDIVLVRGLGLPAKDVAILRDAAVKLAMRRRRQEPLP